jgi:hypothetical protein
MSKPVKHILSALMLLFIQVFVLNKIGLLHGFIHPYVYFIFLLWLPFNISRTTLLFIGFFYGLSLDIFTKTQGLYAFACLWIAYLRPFLINLFIRQIGQDQNYYSPSIKSMGALRYLVLVTICTVLHHSIVQFILFLSIGGFFKFLFSIISYTVISLLLIVVIELLIPRKQNYKTNT